MASADKSNYFIPSEFMEDDGHQLDDEGIDLVLTETYSGGKLTLEIREEKSPSGERGEEIRGEEWLPVEKISGIFDSFLDFLSSLSTTPRLPRQLDAACSISSAGLDPPQKNLTTLRR
jgi:hypothetical protein